MKKKYKVTTLQQTQTTKIQELEVTAESEEYAESMALHGGPMAKLIKTTDTTEKTGLVVSDVREA